MSRIRLEWNIESQKIDKSDSEDPQSKRARRRNLLRLLLLIGLLVMISAAGVIFVRQRLLDLQEQMEQLLKETVSAEVAALRIGDVFTYLKIQDSENQEWRQKQQATFRQYSDLKAREDLVLTGKVLDLEIDGQRARAMVEEIINGVPYVQVWFYLRDAQGWQHVPPDYGFWGEARSIEVNSTVVNYRAADETSATIISETISKWWRQGCEILRCGSIPTLYASIVTDAVQPLSWTGDNRLTLLVLSPYVGRTRTDMPFGVDMQRQIAETLAERLVDLHTSDLLVMNPHDVVYLRQSVISYLADRFQGVDSGTSLVKSLVAVYDEGRILAMLRQFAPQADMSILRQVIQVPIEDAKLDWRDFIKWRLNTDSSLLADREEQAYLSRYDTSDAAAQQFARQRFQDNRPERVLDVVDQLIWQRPDGSPQLRITANMEAGAGVEQRIVLFNLVDGVWKRAS